MRHTFRLSSVTLKVSNYTHFAQLYDAFMKDAPYDRWVSFTEEILSEYAFVARTILDLGCGTGEIALRFAKKGYDVTGVDLSAEMLTIADEKARVQATPIAWIHQDLRTMEGIGEVDLAISYCDVINYITEEDELKQVFERVYDSLAEGGLFIFDVHGLSYAEQQLMDQTFSDVDEDMAYIWNCFSGKRRGELFHELTFFAKQGNQYERFDEDHSQRTYEPVFYEQLLQKAGFSMIRIYSDFQLKIENHDEITERNFIVAQKQSR